MKLTYQLTQDDLLKFNEYHCAHSQLHIKARKRHRTIVPIIYLALAVFGALTIDFVFASILLLFAVLWFLLSPRWLTRRYRNHFQKYIDENLKDIIKEPSTVEILDDGIHSTSFIGHSIFKYQAVEKIVEDDALTYIYIGKGMAIIIPHDRVSESELKDLLAEVETRKQLANQRVDPTVKTPVESGNEQGTAGHP
jgi:hypothetical protein